MARSPEEIAANKALHEAIQAAMNAYRATRDVDEPGLIQEWVVVVAEITPGETPEDDLQSYSILMADGGIPWHRAYGLLMAGKRHFDMVEDVNH